VRLVLGVLMLTAVSVALTNLADDAPGAVEILSDGSWPWLAGAVAAEATCYLFIGVLLRLLLGGGLGRLLALRMGVLIYGLGSILPASPAPGMAIATVELRRRGATTSQLGLAMFWCLWFNIRAFLVLAAYTGASAAVRGRLPEGTGELVVIAVSLIAAGLALATALISSPVMAQRIGALAARVHWRGAEDSVRQVAHLHAEAMAMAGNRRRQALLGGIALATWVADAICLRLVLIAFGVHVSMGIILIAYVATNVAALVSIVPAGLGFAELTTAAILKHYGVSVDRAVAGTLAWRGVSLFLPAIVGLAVYGTFFVRRSAPADDA
jgi:hypothetical protein